MKGSAFTICNKDFHLVTLLVFLTSTTSFGFEGIPETRTVLDGNQSETTKITKSEKREYKVVIEGVPGHDGLFLWKTRGNRKMIKSETDGFEFYMALDGVGFVKVAKSGNDLLTGYRYVECMPMGLRLLCYYGN
jgi:hypothetical protein